MIINEVEYNSCEHFERLCDLPVSWDIADLAVDGTAARLVDVQRGLLVDEPYDRVPTYLNDYFKGRDLGRVATHIERVKTARPRMTVLVRLELHTKMLAR